MILKTLQKSKSSNGIAFFKIGSGHPIIFIHGLGLRAECWFHQIEELKKNHTVYAIDMPGHGKSDLLNDKKVSLKSFVKALVEFIKIQKIDRPIIVGHSLGALIAIELAGLYPKLPSAIIAVTPIYNRSPEATKAVKLRAKEILENPNDNIIIHEPIKRWFGNSKAKINIESADACRKFLKLNKKIFNLQGYTTAYGVFAQIKGNSLSTLKKIQAPSLYITGEKDFNSTPEMSQKLSKINKSSYIVIKNARHLLPLTHAKQFNSHLNHFINSLKLDL